MARKSKQQITRIPLTFSDEEARRQYFGELFGAYEENLTRLAFGLCKDRQAAQDLVHDVFAKLWENHHQLPEIRSAEAFLVTMTRNRVLDYLRKAATEARLRQAIWDSMQELAHDQHVQLEEQEYRQTLDRAIDRLPRQRRIIYRMRSEGYSYHEISEKLNISRHTVKNQVSAALRALKDALSRLMLFF